MSNTTYPIAPEIKCILSRWVGDNKDRVATPVIVVKHEIDHIYRVRELATGREYPVVRKDLRPYH